MENVNYATRYRHIYIKICEFILSVKSVSVFKEFAIPLIRKIIRNYNNRFKAEIMLEKERMICDEYIKSLEKLVEIMQSKINIYEKNREIELDSI